MLRKLSALMLVIALFIPYAAFAADSSAKMGVKSIEAEAFSGDAALETITLDEDLDRMLILRPNPPPSTQPYY